MQCPSGSYLINNTCHQCPAGTVYDKVHQKCKQCPAGSYYNAAQDQCLVNTTSSSTCPNSTFWDGRTCVTCFLPSYWNLDTLKCENCSSGLYYNVNTRKCQTCPNGTIFDLNKYQCVWSGGSNTTATVNTNNVATTTSTTSSTNGNCPSTAPFWNGNTCVSCYLPQYWNHDTKKC